MGPTLRVSCLGLLLVSLFLRCESLLASSELEKERRGLRCNGNQGECQKACPKGWMFYKDNCYGLYEEPLTWSAAEVTCQTNKRNAHLASFLNLQELKEMARYISSTHATGGHVWIGLYDPRKTGNWQWLDLAIMLDLPWDDGEPNNANHNEYCAHLAAHRGFEKLNDAPCSLELPYICKYAL